MEKLTVIFKYSYRHKSKTMHAPHSTPVHINAPSSAQPLARLVTLCSLEGLNIDIYQYHPNSVSFILSIYFILFFIFDTLTTFA